MDRKAIETLSVNAVRDSVVVSDYLDQFIADNDKEPSWDGFVYIYNDKSKKKGRLKGRVPVQIKGTENNDHSKEEISFPVLLTDLNNYLYDGGIVFFVVYIDSTGSNKQIYYAELPPIMIRVLLSEAKGHTSKSIKLKKFPDDPNRKAMIFLNCLQNCQKQASFCSADLQSIEELAKNEVLEGISMSVPTVEGIDPVTALLTNDVYLYANIKGSAIPQPIELIPRDLIAFEERPALICVGPRQFYSKVTLIRDAKKVTTKIGQSFTICASEDTQTVNMSYTSSDSLRTLAIDLDFLLSFIENKGFQYNGIGFPYDESCADFSRFDITAQKQRLEYVKKVVQTLDCLGCKKDINIKSLTQNDWNNLNRLVRAITDKEPVDGLKSGLPLAGYWDVGDLHFALCLFPVEGKDGSYRMYDLFRTDLSLYYKNQNGDQVPASQYIVFHADELLKTDNLRYETLLPSFQKIERHSEVMGMANAFMLELIKAFDKASDRKELIETAAAFSEWLDNATEEELPYDVRLLNKLQIEKRMDGLSIDRIKELYRIVESPNIREDVLVGAYLLLDQQTAAEMHFAKMDQQLQEDFRTYPIYHFWSA